MKKEKVFVTFVLFSLLLILTSCGKSIPVEKECRIDTDCVPSVCCHATDSVNEENAPNCDDIFCSLECEPGTLDCGQGITSCVEGACTVIMK